MDSKKKVIINLDKALPIPESRGETLNARDQGFIEHGSEQARYHRHEQLKQEQALREVAMSFVRQRVRDTLFKQYRSYRGIYAGLGRLRELLKTEYVDPDIKAEKKKIIEDSLEYIADLSKLIIALDIQSIRPEEALQLDPFVQNIIDHVGQFTP